MENIEFETDTCFPNHSMPKKRRLGPQNGSGSLGPENLEDPETTQNHSNPMVSSK